MKRRCRSEVAVLQASVALMWLGGRTAPEIAKACGISRIYVYDLAGRARAEGIDLPKRHGGRKGPRGPGRPRPAQRSPDRDDILDAWEDGLQARDIALLTRWSLGSVKEIVRRARVAGDARAVRHRRWPEPAVVMRACA